MPFILILFFRKNQYFCLFYVENWRKYKERRIIKKKKKEATYV